MVIRFLLDGIQQNIFKILSCYSAIDLIWKIGNIRVEIINWGGNMNYIMVIDDSPTIRTSVEFSIKEFGCEIQQAENGEDALQKISKIKSEGNDVSLCIVDVNMPVMDGISFVKEFKKNDKFTPVLMLTTESEEEKIKEGKTAGASGWMIKPFKPDNLKDVVGKLMR